MNMNLKQNLLKKSKTIVIKVGTNVLTKESGSFDIDRITQIATQIDVLSQGHKKNIILVSSGAIGAGMDQLKISKRPKSLPKKQALAAVGQSILTEAYRRVFNQRGIEIAQILVTKEDFQNKIRHFNITNTILALLSNKILPIINENDTVSTHEITFGDNDQLCALFSQALNADLTVILSSIDGLLDIHNNRELIPFVDKIDSKVLSKISSEKSLRGAGGMTSKISAIKQCVRSGIPVILANGKKENILINILNGLDTGTLFNAEKNKLKTRKSWIAYSADTKGEIYIDQGANNALINNSSLLAIGIKRISGNFDKGDVVSIKNKTLEIGKGLSNYSSFDLKKLIGLKSSEFKNVITNANYDEIIHKNNLVLT